ncbi:MAG: DNA-protecting protein DprA [Opitutales bacterium]|nr:DNA-protecting protein DprA [Opitutales bacterium]MBT5815636.1 DNA-protecting protein DprA [Opitutales bacterium]
MGKALTRRDAYWVLNGLPGIGPVSLNRLLDRFSGDPLAVLDAGESELVGIAGVRSPAVNSLLRWRSLFDLEREKEMANSLGMTFVDREDNRYPDLLKKIHDPPIGMYVLGDYDFRLPSVAIVGSRRTTLYGQGVAREMARELAGRGICVTSGLARGIDTLAHRGALESDRGSTVAVLGCGLDIVYPPENIDLYREIGKRGAVVSEFPFRRRADKQTFPMRNRLVSGMSQAVVVVESDQSGGSLITAGFAGEQGRLVCAVPGRIDQRTSAGCNRLIRDGALLLTSVEDLLEELEHEAEMPELDLPYSGDRKTDIEDLSEQDKALLKLFTGGESLAADRIGQLLGRSSPEISSDLMILELKGYIAKRLDGCFEAVSTYR